MTSLLARLVKTRSALQWIDRAGSLAFSSSIAGFVGANVHSLYNDWLDGWSGHGDDASGTRRQKLVVVGSGWGAVGVIKKLKKGRYDITCVPLLPSVAVGTLHAASLVEPIRNICSRVDAEFIQAKVVDVDPEAKKLTIQSANDPNDKTEVPYDVLLFAVGARSVTWGVPGVEENCLFLKSISDARRARTQIISLFEEASLPHRTEEERKKLLHFVVVGGGPTGVEFAAELHDFIHEDLVKAFPDLANNVATISLIQSGEHILNTYDVAISNYTEKHFKLNHIELIVNARVEGVEPGRLKYSNKEKEQKMLDFGLCLWSTGIGPQPITEKLAQKLGPAQPNKRALLTDDRLRVLGAKDIYSLGDCSTIDNPRLVKRTLEFFKEADENGDDRLEKEEFERLTKIIVKRYPQLEVHMDSAAKMFHDYDQNGDGFLSLTELEMLLADVDKKLKALPATAQVASQQGHYLARLFNRTYKGPTVTPVDDFRPFVYHHFGSFSYVGGDKAVFDYGPGMWAGGLAAFFLWRSAYFSEQVSMSTRIALIMEWIQRPVIGRNIAKY